MANRSNKVRLMNIILMIFSLIVLPGNQVVAANIYQFNAKQSIKAEISSKEMTRIEFGKYGISSVIGDENKYLLLHDEGASSIFIKPKLVVGSKFSISLISIGGRVQDLDLTVRDQEIGAIIIKMDLDENKQELRTVADDEIAQILKFMQKGEKGKYYVEEANDKLEVKFLHESLSSKMILTKKQIYRFGDITGVVLNLSNNSNKALALREDYFQNIYDRTLAVVVGSNMVPKRSSMPILVVCRRGDSDR